MAELNLIRGGKISGARTVLVTPPRPSPHHAIGGRDGMAVSDSTPRVCAVCGGKLPSASGSRWLKYCSDACRRAIRAERARTTGAIKHRKYIARKRAENQDYTRAIHRKWRALNRAKELARQKKWTADNIESERKRNREAMRLKRATKGKRNPAETRSKRSASLKLAWAEGRHPVNVSYRYTSLAKTLHAYLASTREITLEPEVRFGRFTVDLYDRANHVGYEADGTYWHQKNEVARPGYHAERDAYLRREFGLSVVHFTDVEIKALTRGKVA